LSITVTRALNKTVEKKKLTWNDGVRKQRKGENEDGESSFSSCMFLWEGKGYWCAWEN